jgi:hypothetical protein
MPVHVRVCRECGEEYRPGVIRCADCGGELEDRFDGAGAPPPAAEETSPALAEHRAVFVTHRAADLVPLAERLREAGIVHRLAEFPGRGEGAPARYALFVQEASSAAALAALADLVAPHEDRAAVHGIETRFDAEHGYRECPACGAHVAPRTVECPECGLVLGAADGELEGPGD